MRIIAISQDDLSLEKFADILPRFKNSGITIAADIGYVNHREYARTTSYLVDERGIIRQIFPMEVYGRAPTWALLNEMDRIWSP